MNICTWYQVWSEESSYQCKQWKVVHHISCSANNTFHKQHSESQSCKHNIVHGSCRQKEEEHSEAQSSKKKSICLVWNTVFLVLFDIPLSTWWTCEREISFQFISTLEQIATKQYTIFIQLSAQPWISEEKLISAHPHLPKKKNWSAQEEYWLLFLYWVRQLTLVTMRLKFTKCY